MMQSEMSPEARALLDAAAANPPVPSAEQRRRMRDGLFDRVAAGAAQAAAAGASGGASVGAAGAKAIASKSLASVARRSLAVLAVVGTVGAGVVQMSADSAPPAPNEKTRANEPAMALPPPPVSAVTLPAPDETPIAEEKLVSPSLAKPVAKSPLPPRHATTYSPADSAPRAQDTGLAFELAGLSAAQSAIARGDAPAALDALDGIDRNVARGRLVEERDAARVIALCVAGRTEEAAPLRARFARLHASSPLLSRVAHACASAHEAD